MATSAHATAVLVEFEGIFTSTELLYGEPGPVPLFETGKQFSGRFSFDPDLAGRPTDPNLDDPIGSGGWIFPYPASSETVRFGTESAVRTFQELGPTSDIVLFDDHPTFADVLTFRFLGIGVDAEGEDTQDGFAITLQDLLGGSLENETLTTGVFDLSLWDTATIRGQSRFDLDPGIAWQTIWNYEGELTRLTVVPEPTTALLLALGLAVLANRSRTS